MVVVRRRGLPVHPPRRRFSESPAGIFLRLRLVRIARIVRLSIAFGSSVDLIVSGLVTLGSVDFAFCPLQARHPRPGNPVHPWNCPQIEYVNALLNHFPHHSFRILLRACRWIAIQIERSPPNAGPRGPNLLCCLLSRRQPIAIPSPYLSPTMTLAPPHLSTITKGPPLPARTPPITALVPHVGPHPRPGQSARH